MPNNVYLKGSGDFEPECTLEPTCEQIVSATKENAYAVAKNSLEFKEMLMQALIEYNMHGTTNGLDLLASASCGDLLHRGEI